MGSAGSGFRFARRDARHAHAPIAAALVAGTGSQSSSGCYLLAVSLVSLAALAAASRARGVR